MAHASTQLGPPARYWPFLNGRYEVKANLFRFGRDFGNGPADQQSFQIDQDFMSYRAAKMAARRDGIDQQVLEKDYGVAASSAVSQFVVQGLSRDHPRDFRLDQAGDQHKLRCELTGERIVFDADWQLDDAEPRASPPYTSALDALACQVQEDLTVTCAAGPRQWLAAIHVCMPADWAPRDKIGSSFAEVHAGVPHIQDLNAKQDEFVTQMIGATSGLVRFVWGLQTDDHLGADPAAITRFDPQRPRVFLRIERQCIWGLPHVQTSMFTIRTYLQDVDALPALARTALATALGSMSEASIAYKGLTSWYEPLLTWLEKPLRGY